MTLSLRPLKRNRTYVPTHRLHKPSRCGVVTLGGRDFYTGRWGTDRAASRYDALVRSYLASGRTSVTVTSAA